eukprot:3996673-Amphidinium_carterae.1
MGHLINNNFPSRQVLSPTSYSARFSCRLKTTSDAVLNTRQRMVLDKKHFKTTARKLQSGWRIDNGKRRK